MLRVENLKQVKEARGKHYYANGNTFSKANNEFPASHINSVVCGDSLVVLKELPDNCVDLIFTSPPYNFGLDYDSTDDAFEWETYFDSLFAIFDECIRILKYGGRVIINIQPTFSDYIPTHHIISQYFMGKQMIWKCEIIWEKNNYSAQYTAWGSWKSPSSPYLKHTWEFIEVFCKGSIKKDGDPKNADIDEESFKKWVNARWVITPEKNMDRFGHPAMFPEALADRVLRLFSFKGDVIVDPFVGVGTTCLSARMNGRGYFGVDISPEYCQTAEDRLRLLF